MSKYLYREDVVIKSMHQKIINSGKFDRASVIICLHQYIGKPIHLGSHTWQLSIGISSFALKVMIHYKQCNRNYLILPTISLVYFKVKNQ